VDRLHLLIGGAMSQRCIWCGRKYDLANLYKIVSSEIVSNLQTKSKSFFDEIKRAEFIVCDNYLLDVYMAIKRSNSKIFQKLSHIANWYMENFFLKFNYLFFKLLALFVALPIAILELLFAILRVSVPVIETIITGLVIFVGIYIIFLIVFPLFFLTMAISLMGIYESNAIILKEKIKNTNLPKWLTTIISILCIFCFVFILTEVIALGLFLTPYVTGSLETTYLSISFDLFPPFVEVTMDSIVLYRVEYYHFLIIALLAITYKIFDKQKKAELRKALLTKLNLHEIYEVRRLPQA